MMLANLALMLASAALASTTPAADAPVLARTVERGETLSPSDFTTAALSPATARGAIAPDAAAGREATRRLAMGSPVRANDIAAPRIVRRGEAVTITLVSGALRITAGGRALSDAAKGQTVRVINLSTSRTLDAVAVMPGQVRIMAQ